MPNFEDAIADLEGASKAKPDASGLRAIRATLIESDFFFLLDDIISRSHNRPEACRELESRLLAIKFGFREQASSISEDHVQMATIVTGSGLAVGVGGILGTPDAAFAFRAFPVAADRRWRLFCLARHARKQATRA